MFLNDCSPEAVSRFFNDDGDISDITKQEKDVQKSSINESCKYKVDKENVN